MSTQKTERPINMVVEAVKEWEYVDSLVREVDRLARECRAIPFGIEREQCYMNHVFPLLNQLNDRDYSVEWDTEAEKYMLVEDGVEWVHPTIRRR